MKSIFYNAAYKFVYLVWLPVHYDLVFVLSNDVNGRSTKYIHKNPYL